MEATVGPKVRAAERHLRPIVGRRSSHLTCARPMCSAASISGGVPRYLFGQSPKKRKLSEIPTHSSGPYRRSFSSNANGGSDDGGMAQIPHQSRLPTMKTRSKGSTGSKNKNQSLVHELLREEHLVLISVDRAHFLRLLITPMGHAAANPFLRRLKKEGVRLHCLSQNERLFRSALDAHKPAHGDSLLTKEDILRFDDDLTQVLRDSPFFSAAPQNPTALERQKIGQKLKAINRKIHSEISENSRFALLLHRYRNDNNDASGVSNSSSTNSSRDSPLGSAKTTDGGSSESKSNVMDSVLFELDKTFVQQTPLNPADRLMVALFDLQHRVSAVPASDQPSDPFVTLQDFKSCYDELFPDQSLTYAVAEWRLSSEGIQSAESMLSDDHGGDTVESRVKRLSNDDFFEYLDNFDDFLLVRRVNVDSQDSGIRLMFNNRQTLTVQSNAGEMGIAGQWPMTVVCESEQCDSWFWQLYGGTPDPSAESMKMQSSPLVTFNVIPPNFLSLTGKLSTLDSTIAHLEWLDQVEQMQSQRGRSQSLDKGKLSQSDDFDWKLHVSRQPKVPGSSVLPSAKHSSEDEKPLNLLGLVCDPNDLVGGSNARHSSSALSHHSSSNSSSDAYGISELKSNQSGEGLIKDSRCVISKDLLIYGLSKSYFCDFNRERCAEMAGKPRSVVENVDYWLDSKYFVSHPFHCPLPVSLREFILKFTDLSSDLSSGTMKLPSVVAKTLIRKIDGIAKEIALQKASELTSEEEMIMNGKMGDAGKSQPRKPMAVKVTDVPPLMPNEQIPQPLQQWMNEYSAKVLTPAQSGIFGGTRPITVYVCDAKFPSHLSSSQSGDALSSEITPKSRGAKLFPTGFAPDGSLVRAAASASATSAGELSMGSDVLIAPDRSDQTLSKLRELLLNLQSNVLQMEHSGSEGSYYQKYSFNAEQSLPRSIKENPILKNRMVAVADYDLAALWKAHFGTHLPLKHDDLMRHIIRYWFAFFDVRLVPKHQSSQMKGISSSSSSLLSDDSSGEGITPLSQEFIRAIALRPQFESLTSTAEAPKSVSSALTPTPESSTVVSKAKLHERIKLPPGIRLETNIANVRGMLETLVTQFYPSGLFLSQLQSKMIEHFGVVTNLNSEEPNMLHFVQNECDTLWVMVGHPKFDPLVVRVKEYQDLHEYLTRELSAHDQRDGQGIPLQMTLSWMRSIAPEWIDSWKSEIASEQQYRQNMEYSSTKTTAATTSYSSAAAAPSLTGDGLLDKAVDFLKQSPHIDLDTSNPFDIRVFFSPDLHEIHDAVYSTVQQLTSEFNTSLADSCAHNNATQSDTAAAAAISTAASVSHPFYSSPTIGAITAKLRAKFPALEPDKYGSPDLRELIKRTPGLSLYGNQYRLSPEIFVPENYAVLSNALESVLVGKQGGSLNESQLMEQLATHTGYDYTDIHSMRSFRAYFSPFIYSIPKYFSHIIVCDRSASSSLPKSNDSSSSVVSNDDIAALSNPALNAVADDLPLYTLRDCHALSSISIGDVSSSTLSSLSIEKHTTPLICQVREIFDDWKKILLSEVHSSHKGISVMKNFVSQESLSMSKEDFLRRYRSKFGEECANALDVSCLEVSPHLLVSKKKHGAKNLTRDVKLPDDLVFYQWIGTEGKFPHPTMMKSLLFGMAEKLQRTRVTIDEFHDYHFRVTGMPLSEPNLECALQSYGCRNVDLTKQDWFDLPLLADVSLGMPQLLNEKSDSLLSMPIPQSSKKSFMENAIRMAKDVDSNVVMISSNDLSGIKYRVMCFGVDSNHNLQRIIDSIRQSSKEWFPQISLNESIIFDEPSIHNCQMNALLNALKRALRVPMNDFWKGYHSFTNGLWYIDLQTNGHLTEYLNNLGFEMKPMADRPWISTVIRKKQDLLSDVKNRSSNVLTDHDDSSSSVSQLSAVDSDSLFSVSWFDNPLFRRKLALSPPDKLYSFEDVKQLWQSAMESESKHKQIASLLPFNHEKDLFHQVLTDINAAASIQVVTDTSNSNDGKVSRMYRFVQTKQHPSLSSMKKPLKYLRDWKLTDFEYTAETIIYDHLIANHNRTYLSSLQFDLLSKFPFLRLDLTHRNHGTDKGDNSELSLFDWIVYRFGDFLTVQPKFDEKSGKLTGDYVVRLKDKRPAMKFINDHLNLNGAALLKRRKLFCREQIINELIYMGANSAVYDHNAYQQQKMMMNEDDTRDVTNALMMDVNISNSPISSSSSSELSLIEKLGVPVTSLKTLEPEFYKNLTDPVIVQNVDFTVDFSAMRNRAQNIGFQTSKSVARNITDEVMYSLRVCYSPTRMQWYNNQTSSSTVTLNKNADPLVLTKPFSLSVASVMKKFISMYRDNSVITESGQFVEQIPVITLATLLKKEFAMNMDHNSNQDDSIQSSSFISGFSASKYQLTDLLKLYGFAISEPSKYKCGPHPRDIFYFASMPKGILHHLCHDYAAIATEDSAQEWAAMVTVTDPKPWKNVANDKSENIVDHHSAVEATSVTVSKEHSRIDRLAELRKSATIAQKILDELGKPQYRGVLYESQLLSNPSTLAWCEGPEILAGGIRFLAQFWHRDVSIKYRNHRTIADSTRGSYNRTLHYQSSDVFDPLSPPSPLSSSSSASSSSVMGMMDRVISLRALPKYQARLPYPDVMKSLYDSERVRTDVMSLMDQNYRETSQKYMTVSELCNKFADEYGYFIPFEPLIKSLNMPYVSGGVSGEMFVAGSSDDLFGARVASIMDYLMKTKGSNGWIPVMDVWAALPDREKDILLGFDPSKLPLMKKNNRYYLEKTQKPYKPRELIFKVELQNEMDLLLQKRDTERRNPAKFVKILMNEYSEEFEYCLESELISKRFPSLSSGSKHSAFSQIDPDHHHDMDGSVGGDSAGEGSSPSSRMMNASGARETKIGNIYSFLVRRRSQIAPGSLASKLYHSLSQKFRDRSVVELDTKSFIDEFVQEYGLKSWTMNDMLTLQLLPFVHCSPESGTLRFDDVFRKMLLNRESEDTKISAMTQSKKLSSTVVGSIVGSTPDTHNSSGRAGVSESLSSLHSGNSLMIRGVTPQILSPVQMELLRHLTTLLLQTRGNPQSEISLVWFQSLFHEAFGMTFPSRGDLAGSLRNLRNIEVERVDGSVVPVVRIDSTGGGRTLGRLQNFAKGKGGLSNPESVAGLALQSSVKHRAEEAARLPLLSKKQQFEQSASEIRPYLTAFCGINLSQLSHVFHTNQKRPLPFIDANHFLSTLHSMNYFPLYIPMGGRIGDWDSRPRPIDAVLLPRANNTGQTQLLATLNQLFLNTLRKRETMIAIRQPRSDDETAATMEVDGQVIVNEENNQSEEVMVENTLSMEGIPDSDNNNIQPPCIRESEVFDLWRSQIGGLSQGYVPFGTVQNVTQIICRRFAHIYRVGYDEFNGEPFYSLRPRVSFDTQVPMSDFKPLEMIIQEKVFGPEITRLRLSEFQNRLFDAIPKNSNFPVWSLSMIMNTLPFHLSHRFVKMVMPMGIVYPDPVIGLFKNEEFHRKCSELSRLSPERLLIREHVLRIVGNNNRVPFYRVHELLPMEIRSYSLLSFLVNNCSTDFLIEIGQVKRGEKSKKSSMKSKKSQSESDNSNSEMTIRDEFLVSVRRDNYVSQKLDNQSTTSATKTSGVSVHPSSSLPNTHNTYGVLSDDANVIAKLCEKHVEKALLKMRLNKESVPVHEFQTRLYQLSQGHSLQRINLISPLCEFGGFRIDGSWSNDTASFRSFHSIPFNNRLAYAVIHTVVNKFDGADLMINRPLFFDTVREEMAKQHQFWHHGYDAGGLSNSAISMRQSNDDLSVISGKSRHSFRPPSNGDIIRCIINDLYMDLTLLDGGNVLSLRSLDSRTLTNLDMVEKQQLSNIKELIRTGGSPLSSNDNNNGNGKVLKMSELLDPEKMSLFPCPLTSFKGKNVCSLIESLESTGEFCVLSLSNGDSIISLKDDAPHLIRTLTQIAIKMGRLDSAKPLSLPMLTDALCSLVHPSMLLPDHLNPHRRSDLASKNETIKKESQASSSSTTTTSNTISPSTPSLLARRMDNYVAPYGGRHYIGELYVQKLLYNVNAAFVRQHMSDLLVFNNTEHMFRVRKPSKFASHLQMTLNDLGIERNETIMLDELKDALAKRYGSDIYGASLDQHELVKSLALFPFLRLEMVNHHMISDNGAMIQQPKPFELLPSHLDNNNDSDHSLSMVTLPTVQAHNDLDRLNSAFEWQIRRVFKDEDLIQIEMMRPILSEMFSQVGFELEKLRKPTKAELLNKTSVKFSEMLEHICGLIWHPTLHPNLIKFLQKEYEIYETGFSASWSASSAIESLKPTSDPSSSSSPSQSSKARHNRALIRQSKASRPTAGVFNAVNLRRVSLSSILPSDIGRRYLGFRLSELGRLLSENFNSQQLSMSAAKSSWALRSCLENTRDIQMTPVPYGLPDFFVSHPTQLPLINDDQMVSALKKCFRSVNSDDPFSVTLNEPQLRMVWKREIRQAFPFDNSLDLRHAFSFHLSNVMIVFDQRGGSALSSSSSLSSIGRDLNSNDPIKSVVFSLNPSLALRSDGDQNNQQQQTEPVPTDSPVLVSPSPALIRKQSSMALAKKNGTIAVGIGGGSTSMKKFRVNSAMRLEMRKLLDLKNTRLDYKTAEERFVDLYDALVKETYHIRDSPSSSSLSSMMTMDKNEMIDPMLNPLSPMNRPRIYVKFSRLAAEVCQPLKLVQIDDWLAYLLRRFQGHIEFVPERRADLLFELKNVDVLREKSRFYSQCRLNRYIKFSPYERELIYASLIRSPNGERTLKSLMDDLPIDLNLKQYGFKLHNQLNRLYSMDFEFGRDPEKARALSNLLNPDHNVYRRLSKNEERYIPRGDRSLRLTPEQRREQIHQTKYSDQFMDEYYNSFSVSLLVNPPMKTFDSMIQNGSFIDLLMDITLDKKKNFLYLSEIQKQCIEYFGCVIPTLNLNATLLRYGNIVFKLEDHKLHYQECQVNEPNDYRFDISSQKVMDESMQSSISVAFNTLKSLLNYKLERIISKKTQKNSLVRMDTVELDAYKEETEHEFDKYLMNSSHYQMMNDMFVSLDELNDELSVSQHIYLGRSPAIMNELLRYLIHKRSLDFVCYLDRDDCRSSKLKWKIKYRNFISLTNGSTAADFTDIVSLLKSSKSHPYAMKLSMLPSLLYHFNRKVITPTMQNGLSLHKTLEKICADARKEGVPLYIRQCGPDSIIYMNEYSMYREAVDYLLSYHPQGLLATNLRDMLSNLIGKSNTEVRKEINNLYKYLFDYCFGKVKSSRSTMTNVFKLMPFFIDDSSSFQLRMMIYQLSQIEQSKQQYLSAVYRAKHGGSVNMPSDEEGKERRGGEGGGSAVMLVAGADDSSYSSSSDSSYWMVTEKSRLAEEGYVPLSSVKKELEKAGKWSYEMHLTILSAAYLENCKDNDGLIHVRLTKDSVRKDNQSEILHDIITDHTFRCNTQNLQDYYAHATGALLDLSPQSVFEDPSALAVTGYTSHLDSTSALSSSSNRIDPEKKESSQDSSGTSAIKSMKSRSETYQSQPLASSRSSSGVTTETKEDNDQWQPPSYASSVLGHTRETLKTLPTNRRTKANNDDGQWPDEPTDDSSSHRSSYYSETPMKPMRDLLFESGLYLHFNSETKENVILPRVAIIRLRKPWMTRERIASLRRGLSKLGGRYKIRFADFVDEFMIEVPTALARSDYLIHLSGLSTVLSSEDLRIFRSGMPTNQPQQLFFSRTPKLTGLSHADNLADEEQVNDEDADEDGGIAPEPSSEERARFEQYNASKNHQFLDGIVEGRHFSICLGVSAAHLSELVFLRGTVRGFLRNLRRPSISLSELQQLYSEEFGGHRWWSTRIPEQLQKLGCNIVADGKGDFIVDLTVLYRIESFENPAHRDHQQVKFV